MNKDCLRITAVVVTHNRPEELRQVIFALLNQTRKLEQILILDNACLIPATTLLADYPSIDIVRSEVNCGGAGGFALGITAAIESGADWIWLMDDDAVPCLDALSSLLEVLPELPVSVGALCSSVYEYNALALMHRRKFGTSFGMESVISRRLYSQTMVEIDAGSFVGFLVVAQAVKEIGLPAANFFLAYDDTEYSLRLKKAGWSIWLVPKSTINHLRTKTSRLRSSDFGAKHYYNIRNHIVVVMLYSRFPILAGCFATLYGFGLWIFCSRHKLVNNYWLFGRAIKDGWCKNLGVFR